MPEIGMTDERLNALISRASETWGFGTFDVHILGALVELKLAREKIELMLDHIAKLNGLLDWAYDGLDDYWVTLPENVEKVALVAEMFGRKPR